MSYSTGTASSIAQLKTAIEAFATGAGWTVSGNVTSKGSVYVRLTSPAAWSLKIEGANSADMATELCGQSQQIIIPTSAFPVSYFLFAHSSPDTLVVVVNYDVIRFQWIAFGALQKQGTWTGGNWFGATHSSSFSESQHDSIWLESAYGGGGPFSAGSKAFNSSSPGLFWTSLNWETFAGAYNGGRSTHLHCKLDGNIWPGAGAKGNDVPAYPSFSRWIFPLQDRTPNVFNSQSVMTPIWVYFPRTDGYLSLLGHVEHIRSIRVDNYDPGQVITIGAERWKVFPWYRKDTVNPLGGVRSGYSGCHGFAVRYDGP